MENTQQNYEDKFVQINLELAQQALQSKNLVEAQNLFAEALAVSKVPSNWAGQIRQTLKQYSDQVTKEQPPDWPVAQATLELLMALNLADDQTRDWQNDLKLNQARFLLSQQDLEGSFNAFTDLLSDREQFAIQLGNISAIVRDYVSVYAIDNQWHLVQQMIERLRALWPKDETRAWLETLLATLTALDQTQTKQQQSAEESLHNLKQTLASSQKTVGDQEETIKNLAEALAQAKRRVYLWLAVFIITFVAYTLIFLL